MGIGKNIHTIPTTFSTRFAAMNCVCSFQKRSPPFSAVTMTSLCSDVDAIGGPYATAGYLFPLRMHCNATSCNKSFLSLARGFNDGS